MSWHCSVGQVDQVWLANFLASLPSVELKSMPMQDQCCCRGRGRGSCQCSLYGQILDRLMERLGGARFSAQVVDSPALTFLSVAEGQASQVPKAAFGQRWQGSLERSKAHTALWKTHQCSLAGDLMSFSGTWPAWGMMRDGVCYQLKKPVVLPIKESASGSLVKWPTPTASMRPCEGTARAYRRAVVEGRSTRAEAMAMNDGRDVFEAQGGLAKMDWPAPVGEDLGRISSAWVCWLMGWPVGWHEADEPMAADAYTDWWSGMADGSWWDAEPVARVVVGAKRRAPRLRALGNGWVPMQAAVAFVILMMMFEEGR